MSPRPAFVARSGLRGLVTTTLAALVAASLFMAPLAVESPHSIAFAMQQSRGEPLKGTPTQSPTASSTKQQASPTAAATPTVTPTPAGTSVRKTVTRVVVAPSLENTPTLVPEPAPVAGGPIDSSSSLGEAADPGVDVDVEAEGPDSDPWPSPILLPPVVSYVPATVRDSVGLSLHVLRYVGLVLGAAHEVGVDPAIIAALMEVEGSGETSVSSAGAAGLMQLMPDKLLPTDDPFDPGTNILRAAQYIARLARVYQGDLAAIAGAYFGAIDDDGNVTDDSDGIVNGIQYVTRFASAYERWAAAFDQPSRPIAIRPVIRQREPMLSTSSTAAAGSDVSSGVLDGPERDRWYLFLERPQPALPPLFF